MKNNYGTIRVYNIKTAAGMLKTVVDLDNVDLSADINTEVRERLEAEEKIAGVVTFEWEIVEPSSELADSIRKVLSRYFENHSNGTPSDDYDDNFSAQDALDEITSLIGEY